MPALSFARQQAMDNALLHLQRRLLSHLDYCVSTDQYVEMFIPEPLRMMAIETPKYFHLPYRQTFINGKVKLHDYPQLTDFTISAYDWKGQPAPLTPKDYIQFDPSHPHAEGIMRYLESYAEICRQFGLAQRVLNELNDRVGSDAQMRFFWPAMLILLENSGDENMAKSADKLRAPKTPKTLPTLPGWLKAACGETAAVIAAASMIPMKEDVPRPVTLSVRMLGRWDYLGESISCRP